jgi:hypothetical protein
MTDTRESEVIVKAKTYKGFAAAVRQMVVSLDVGESLVLAKAVGNTAVFVDAEGNRTYYIWERE